MTQRTLRNMVVVGALVTCLAVFASPANAGWGHWRGYYSYGGWGLGACCDPCYTACMPCYDPCLPCCDPCATVCCDPCATTCVGPLRRLWNRLCSHHYRYYGCGWTCCDPCDCCTPCCPVCSCDPCCCGSTFESEGTVIEGPIEAPAMQVPTPAQVPPPTKSGAAAVPPSLPPASKKPADIRPALPKPPAPAKKPALAPPAAERQTSLGPHDALLTVRVPANAKVFVNGAPTRSTGTIRRYVSRNLTPGYQYTYQLRVISEQNGRPVVESRTVRLHAGQATQLAFADIAKPTETLLTLHVPSDAKVYLAGKEMAGKGSVRTFRTHRLAPGQTWHDYAIQVTVKQNGQTLAKEKAITLSGGERRELTFDFDVDRLASAK